MFLLILYSIIAADVFWWHVVDRKLCSVRFSSLWRSLFGVMMFALALYVLTIRYHGHLSRSSESPIPTGIHVFVYIWHFLILPTLAMIVLAGRLISWIRAALRGRQSEKRPAAPLPGAAGPTNAALPFAEGRPLVLSRRQAMTAAAAAALPTLVAVGASVGAIRTLNGMRVRTFSLNLPDLPPRLDGATIAHVSDTHIGKFLHPDRLPAIADSINRLDADFIAFTGDLIDMGLEDLPHGIRFLRSLKSRCGMAICEGNHDLMQNRGEFENQVLEAGLPILVGQQRTLDYVSRDGRHCPIQFLATPWNRTDETTFDAVNFLRPSVADDAFAILLAHHPHSFDAADARFPLVLSGHTHGGQIMFTPQVGLAQLRFRYISGLYQKPGSSLIVNNGIGNWFPLRVNAPAEIIHITLRRFR